MFKNLAYRIYDFFTLKQIRYLKYFIELEKKTIPELEEFQIEKLRDLSKKLPGISIDNWEDFYKLPITKKQDLVNSPLYPDENIKTHETSGSTGEPRVIWVPEDSWNRKDAIFMRSWIHMGRKNQKVLRLISGDPKYSKYDYFRNVFPKNYKTLDKSYADWVVKNKPFLIHGPGGSIRQLCEYLIEMEEFEVLKNLKIHWCSESSEGHKDRLEKFVKEFHEQFGMAELPTVGATDGLGNLRVLMEQGVIEVLDDNNKPVGEDEEGFITVTDFNNYQTPIIRYQTGDRCKIKKITTNDLEYYVIYDIIGRGVDYYYGPEVKKPIGWWIVAPISHILSDVISKWRCEINIKNRELTLYVEFKEEKNFEKLEPYANWVQENLGLKTKFVEAQKESYDIYWKNKLVKVIN